MDLTTDEVLFFGAIVTMTLLGWDNYQNRKPITKAEIPQSCEARPDKPQQKREGAY